MLGPLGGLALLTRLRAALSARRGGAQPAAFQEVHGPLTLLGCLGTLNALERVVAVGEPAGCLAPALAGLGGVELLLGLPLLIADTEAGLVGLAWRVAAGLCTTGRDVAPPVP